MCKKFFSTGYILRVTEEGLLVAIFSEKNKVFFTEVLNHLDKFLEGRRRC